MTRPAYYNEIDPYLCEWLRNLITAGLIPAGDVDDRDIRSVSADDLRGYGQCHFLAGVGGFPTPAVSPTSPMASPRLRRVGRVPARRARGRCAC